MAYRQVIEASEVIFAAFEAEASWADRVEMARRALGGILDALDGAAWEASADPDVQRRFVRLAKQITGARVGLVAEAGVDGAPDEASLELLEVAEEALLWAQSGALLPAGPRVAELGPGVELEEVASALEAGEMEEVVARCERELAANPVALMPTLLLASARIALGEETIAAQWLERAQSRWRTRLAGLLGALVELARGDVDAAIAASIASLYDCMMLCPHGFASLPAVTDADEDAFLHATAQALGDEVLTQLGGVSPARMALLDALLRVQPWEAFEELAGLEVWGHALPDAERAAAHVARARLARYFADWSLHEAELEVARGLGASSALLEREQAGAARDRAWVSAGLVEIVGYGDRFSMARTVDHDIVSGVTFAERFPSAERAAERMVRALGHLDDAGYAITVHDEALQPHWDEARSAREEALAPLREWEAEGGWSVERLEAVEAALEEGDADALDAAIAELPAEDAAGPVLTAWAAVLREDWASARRALLTRPHLWAARIVEAVAELADEDAPYELLLGAMGAGALWQHTLLGDAPVAVELLSAPGPLATQALGSVLEVAADAALDLIEDNGWADARGATIQALMAPNAEATLELCAEYLSELGEEEPALRAMLLLASAHWTREVEHDLAAARGFLKRADEALGGAITPALQAQLDQLDREQALLATPQLTLALGSSVVALELDEDGRRHERWGMSGVELTRTIEAGEEPSELAFIQQVRELMARGMRPV
jgi:hypothetical protein